MRKKLSRSRLVELYAMYQVLLDAWIDGSITTDQTELMQYIQDQLEPYIYVDNKIIQKNKDQEV